MALAPISQDAFIGPYIQHQVVRTYIVTGDMEKAVHPLAPLRGNLRFRRLAAWE